MLLTPKKTIIYGPVQSRRLGRSLGVNILPQGLKTCTFNCVYCQYGWTDFERMAAKDKLTWPSAKEVGEALAKALAQLSIPPAYITFSGNGEPTLHPSFPEIVAEVNATRDHFAPTAQTAILSNSTLVIDPDIQKALAKLDRRIMKLDCGSHETFLAYNQPLDGIELEDLVSRLAEMENIIIQALFSSGEAGNFSDAGINSWLEKIKQIRPIHVQIYSLDRGVPAENISPVSRADLERITTLVRKEQIRADFY